MGDQSGGPGQQRTRDYEPRTEPRHHEHTDSRTRGRGTGRSPPPQTTERPPPKGGAPNKSASRNHQQGNEKYHRRRSGAGSPRSYTSLSKWQISSRNRAQRRIQPFLQMSLREHFSHLKNSPSLFTNRCLTPFLSITILSIFQLIRV